MSETLLIWECEKCQQRFPANPGWAHWNPPNWRPRLYCHGKVHEYRYVDVDRLLFHLRYIDWQEDTAAEAIEAWIGRQEIAA